MKTILCTGEMLIDFMADEKNISLSGQNLFHKKPGGAPGNVACVIGALGGKSAIFSCVGNDPFGECLKNALLRFNVDISALVRSSEPTTLAFVSLFENGARDFIFVRGADAKLELSTLPQALKEAADLYHFGAATAFLEGALQNTYVDLLAFAVENQKLISFDPNYRSAFWANHHPEYRTAVMPFIEKAHFVKVSDEEAMLIFQSETLEEAITIMKRTVPGTVAVTLGENGTRVFNAMWDITVPAPKIQAIDTTGAGDAFVGAFLYALSKHDRPIEVLSNSSEVVKIVEEANAIAAKVCTQIGALTALEGA